MPLLTRATGVLRSSSKNGYGLARFSYRIAASKASSGFMGAALLIAAVDGIRHGAHWGRVRSTPHRELRSVRHAPGNRRASPACSPENQSPADAVETVRNGRFGRGSSRSTWRG